MPTTQMDTDYLILGAGAMGMAFADVILGEDPTASIVMVDRHANPGGHWNDAYPFVRLHQPAAFYGLASTQLGHGGEDLSSGADLVAYYRDAMDRFLRTGRVRFLPMSEHEGAGRVVSTLDREVVTTVAARRRTVDSTYMQVNVPSTCPPSYTVDAGVTLIPPNGLAQIRRPWERYVVIGAGKTGIDSILFLLDNGVAPNRVQWIVSNDAWLWDRGTVQPGSSLQTIVSMMRGIVGAADIDETFLQLERRGIVSRVDTESLPTKWRCATVDRRELTELRRVKDVIRLGRVRHVGGREMQLDRGKVGTGADTLFIDCSANGLAKVEPRPLFSEGAIALQSVFMCQQTFSAAVIAHLELLGLSDDRRNRICTAVPHPEQKGDLAAALVASAQNMVNCNRVMTLWLRRCRLFPGHYEPARRYLLGSARLALLLNKAAKMT